MKNVLLGICAITILTSTTNTFAKQSCNDAYAGAVRNISINTREFSESSYTYTQHCSESGQLSESSAGLDLTIPIKKIVFGFKGTKKEAKTQMEKFCKLHSEKKSAFGRFYSVENEVVVNALQSFNECRALEIQGIDIWHQIQDPRSVIVGADFNPAKTNFNLRAVTYNSNIATCRTTGLNSKGTPVVLDDNTSEHKMKKPFSIVCSRTAEETKDGTDKFPRFTLGIDTNHGAYSVTMPVEEVLGFDLASLNKERYIKIIDERSQLQNKNTLLLKERNSLKNTINKANASIHFLVQGKKAVGSYWEHVKCTVHGGNITTHIKNTCNGKKDTSLMLKWLEHEKNTSF